jgi:FO synthase
VTLDQLLSDAGAGRRPTAETALALLPGAMAADLAPVAEALTLEGFGLTVSYSRKVFIPLTHLCRDVCHYCTFAKAPRRVQAPYLSLDQVLEIGRAGLAAGCKEALFTLGDKPELRYPAAARWLEAQGFATTLDYLRTCAQLVLEETGLLPHLNPGVMSPADLTALRPVSASMGIMLETTADRLSQRGGPHWGSPDKLPARRLETLKAAGEQRVPFTTGLLIGIGETRRERIEALLAIRDLHEAHGHIQELIVQNFRAKPGTAMAKAPEPTLEEHLWTVSAARLIFGSDMSIQAPPNLRPGALTPLVKAGVNDWGGVSPVTPDHVNPEAPWPHLAVLAAATAAAGRRLTERLAITPAFARAPELWLDPGPRREVLRKADAVGLARTDGWFAGTAEPTPARLRELVSDRSRVRRPAGGVTDLIDRARDGALDEAGLVALFAADHDDLRQVVQAADALRRETVGEAVTYVVNRNINYTNICLHHCSFCAFSKGGGARDARGPAYRLDVEEVARRSVEAWAAGATEVCLQGGIHPSYTGETYLAILAAVKAATPDMHVHAFSPLEVFHGAQTLGLSLEAYLRRLKAAGLATLPGTAAEILDDEVRQVICPDKVDTAQWLEVMETAHRVGLRSTATIMFGHVDHPRHWARHMLRIRALQARTGGFTEFVPLPFVHMEAPMWRRGQARSGPTFREALLMHAVARLALHPLIPNLQTSWVKMGREGAALCLKAGANDLGGVLMDESITRAAGGVNGQAMTAADLHALAAGVGRPAVERSTLYGPGGRRERLLSA